MKIQDQVCTLYQAKKLKELGVSLNSFFYWQKMGDPVIDGCSTIRLETSINAAHPIAIGAVEENFPAFTVAELGVMLPEYHESHRGPIDKTWYAGKLEMYNTDEWFAIEATEAQARAAFLIHLLENSLVTAGEVNKRLAE